VRSPSLHTIAFDLDARIKSVPSAHSALTNLHGKAAERPAGELCKNPRYNKDPDSTFLSIDCEVQPGRSRQLEKLHSTLKTGRGLKRQINFLSWIAALISVTVA
jgi:hypothetical protein